MLLETVLSIVAGSLLCVVAGPRVAATCLARTFRQLLQNDGFRADLRQAMGETAVELSRSEEELAAIMWSRAMKEGMGDAMVELMQRDDFHEGCARVVAHITKDRTLQDTIRQGVIEALQDDGIKKQLKVVLIEGMEDHELQSAILHSAIGIIKGGIRESLKDAELKEVITEAIRESLSDRRVLDMLKHVIIDAVSDEEIHRAMRQGAVTALFPLQTNQGIFQFVTRRARGERNNGGSVNVDCRDPQVSADAEL